MIPLGGPHYPWEWVGGWDGETCRGQGRMGWAGNGGLICKIRVLPKRKEKKVKKGTWLCLNDNGSNTGFCTSSLIRFPVLGGGFGILLPSGRQAHIF